MGVANEPETGARRTLACVGLFLFGWWLVAASMEPPRALAADAPEQEFSATRALERWRTLPGSAVPHPLGSAAHDELRTGILEVFRRLDCTPEVQEALLARSGIACLLHNVLVRIPGRVHEGALLVCAHYDSVAAGPGAGDDGAGVASVLEIARALKSGAPLERDVILLVDDAEELGLLGARAFCEQHAWAKDVAQVINLEARGTSGPCFLFETSAQNAALITLAADVLRQPSAWSASDEVYQRMPNDTDLSVFKQQGWQGYNLAFIRGLRHYHTPRDEAQNLSPASVQQLGENALALARGLAGGRLDRMAEGHAVYADFLGLVLLHWNQRSNLPIAIGLALAIAFALWTRLRAHRWRVLPVLFCAGTALGGLLLAALVGFGLQALALAGRTGNWPNAAEPLWMRAALGAGTLAAWFALAGARWSARATLEERWAGTALCLALGALALALAFPAASYLAILPLVLTLLGFSLHEIARETLPQGRPWMLAVPAFVMTAGVAAPLLVALEWVFEFRVCAALGCLAGFVFLPLWVMAAEAPRLSRALALGALAAAIGLVCAARASPAWSAEHPGPLTLQHYQESDGSAARWNLESQESELPAVFARDFERAPNGPLAFARGGWNSFQSPAPRFELAPAEFDCGPGFTGPEPLVTLASHAGARLLILQLPEGWAPSTIEWREGWIGFPPGSARRLVLAGFGTAPLALQCKRPAQPARQEQIELFEIGEWPKNATREWIDKRPREFVPLSWGDVSIVHSTRNP